MNLQAMVLFVAVALAAAGISEAEENRTSDIRNSDVATTASFRQNKDYRIHLLGVTKGIAFSDGLATAGEGRQSPGENAVPCLRVVTVIEKLTDKDEPLAFSAESPDGTDVVGKAMVERNGYATMHRSLRIKEIDFDPEATSLRAVPLPTNLPAVRDQKKTKVYIFTYSGKIKPVKRIRLRFSFGGEKDRRELVFKNVPLP